VPCHEASRAGLKTRSRDPGRRFASVVTVIHELAGRLDGRAEVRPARELFERIGPRLDARLGDVAVLPVRGRQAWLRSAAANEQRFRGQHGGLQEAETSTYLARLAD
jgi:hypothetical protein